MADESLATAALPRRLVMDVVNCSGGAVALEVSVSVRDIADQLESPPGMAILPSEGPPAEPLFLEDELDFLATVVLIGDFEGREDADADTTAVVAGGLWPCARCVRLSAE